MSKKVVGLPICAVLLALSLPVEARQREKVPRLGYLDTSTASIGIVKTFCTSSSFNSGMCTPH
jgi:hypothetical protein